MKVVRRFQRTMLVLFVSINTFVFTSMENYQVNDRILFTVYAFLISTSVVLLTAYFSKIIRTRKKMQESTDRNPMLKY